MAFKWKKNKKKIKKNKKVKNEIIQDNSSDLSNEEQKNNPDKVKELSELTQNTAENEINETSENFSTNEDDSITEADQTEKKGRFKRLKQRLLKSRQKMRTRLSGLFSIKKKLDDDLLEELEEILITSDIGVKTVMDIMDEVSEQVKKKIIINEEQLNKFLETKLIDLLTSTEKDFIQNFSKPHIILVIGVNGVGKTTTIGKLAAKYNNMGKKVIIAASDTFRAAAVEQLDIWAQKADVEIVKHRDNADPAAVAFDAVGAAIARNADIVLVDTAGRLHTKKNLMEELKKIKRTIAKKIYDAPHDIFLILDATTGQNAISQANLFNDALGITGLILTKVDGTAKGGIVISISNEINVPIRYLGIGEQIDDLQEFVPEQFIKALL